MLDYEKVIVFYIIKQNEGKIKTMMKAAVLYGINDLRVEECSIPVVKENDVLVKVMACGICGSDVPRILTNGTYHFPTIPGHEFGGIIVETGEKVDKNLLNKQVAVIPLIPCYECSQCKAGNYHMCEHYDYLGSRNDGGFAQYCLVPKDNIVLIPDEVNIVNAALLEPITVAQHVVSNNNLTYGEDVIVYGLGAIGIFVAQWAKAFGARHVFAIDLDEKKVEIAKQIGLEDAICSITDDIHEKIISKTNGQGADIAFEASGNEYVLNDAISLLKKNGRLGLVGRPIKNASLSVNSFEKILRNQINIKGTWAFEMKNFPQNPWQVSLEAIKAGKILTEPIISHRFPIEKTYEGIKIMADKKEFFYKILIEPWRNEL